MGLLRACLALALLLPVSTVSAQPTQLYAISNDHAGRWWKTDGNEEPTVLYHVRDDALTKVRTITTGFEGVFFVRPYQDLGLVLVGAMGIGPESIHLDVIDLSRMSRQKSYSIDSSCGACQIFDGHLLKMDERLIYMAEETDYYNWPPEYEGDGDSSIKVWYHGIDLGTGDRVRGLAGEDIAYAYSFGFADQWSDGVGAQIINNDHINVVVLGYAEYLGPEPVASHLRVSRKADGVSTDIEWPQGYGIRPRGFRQWMVAEEFHGEQGQTGRMVLYNPETGQWVIHDTGEADCEVLLVDEDDVAYYRINDELLRADISGEKLANIERIVKAPEMLNVHWLVKGSW